RHASERRHGTLEGVPENEVGEVPDALKWRLGRFHSAILPGESRDEKRQWDLRYGLGRSAKPAGQKSSREVLASCNPGHHAGVPGCAIAISRTRKGRGSNVQRP